MLSVLGPQVTDRRFEVFERFKRLIDARESEVGNLIELAEGAENRETDFVRIDLALSGLADRLFNLLRQDRQVCIGDGPALARLASARYDLVTAKRLDGAGPLDHVEGRGLHRREATTTLRTLTATTNRQAVIARARVDNAGVWVATKWAMHRLRAYGNFIGHRRISNETRSHSLTVRWQIFGVRERDNAVGDILERTPVVLDDLLWSQEREGAEARGVPRLS